jgi:hypothetical protein
MPSTFGPHALARPGCGLRPILAQKSCQGKICPQKTASLIFKATERFVNLSFKSIEWKGNLSVLGAELPRKVLNSDQSNYWTIC